MYYSVKRCTLPKAIIANVHSASKRLNGLMVRHRLHPRCFSVGRRRPVLDGDGPGLDDGDLGVLHGEEEVDEEEGGRDDGEGAEGHAHRVRLAAGVLVVHDADDARRQEQREAHQVRQQLLKRHASGYDTEN